MRQCREGNFNKESVKHLHPGPGGLLLGVLGGGGGEVPRGSSSPDPIRKFFRLDL